MDATIAKLETILIARARGLIKLGDLSETPDADASPRSYLADPIVYAIRKSGGTTADILTPADSDLATVDDEKGLQLLDLAELRLIDNGLGNWTMTDHTEGPVSQKWAAMAQLYFDRAECLREKVKDEFGVGAEVTQVGDDGLGGFSGGGTTGSSVLGSI